MKTATKFWKEYKSGNIQCYDQELIDNLKNIFISEIPAHIVILSYHLCNHTCHKMAMLLSMGLKEFRLIRGNIKDYPIEGNEPNHSWVETEEWVYDTTNGFKTKKDLYYELHRPSIIESYDQNTLKQDEYYIKLLNRIDTNDQDDKKTAYMVLGLIEHLEKLKPTINGKRLMYEIDEYRKNNLMNIEISKKLMNQYCSEMEKVFF